VRVWKSVFFVLVWDEDDTLGFDGESLAFVLNCSVLDSD
jgi:hypothetical protein